MDSEKKEFGKWWVWLVFLCVGTMTVFAGLNYVGLVGKTVVERKVFENSFQYSEARKTEIAIFEAQLVEVDRKLTNSDLTKTTRTNLEATASAIRVQLSAARRKQ